MNSIIRLVNIFDAMEPLAIKNDNPLDLNQLLILSYLAKHWQLDKSVTIGNIVSDLSKNISRSTILRDLKSLKNHGTIVYRLNKHDERVKFIVQGDNFENFLASTA
jgi:DNA-binding MarR family transcriptional regulator